MRNLELEMRNQGLRMRNWENKKFVNSAKITILHEVAKNLPDYLPFRTRKI